MPLDAMNGSMDAGLRLLFSQLRAVQRAHKAGITPRYGQVEELFETLDAVERQFDREREQASAPRCGTPECGKPPIGGDSAYARLCLDCAGKLIVAALFNGSKPSSELAGHPSSQ